MSILYDFTQDRDLSRFRFEGNGKLSVDTDNCLRIETYRVRPDAKATTVWLRDLTLPDSFEIEFTFRGQAENGNTMVIFNALPVSLCGIFDDPRPDARYCDLASHGKMQAYTVGFYRGVYGRPSVLRKIGGHVPAYWGDAPYPTPEWREMDTVTAMNSTMEPFTEANKSHTFRFLLTKNGDRITFAVNGHVIHDYQDRLEYPYCDAVLKGGHMAFRNFGGPAIDVYESFVIRSL